MIDIPTRRAVELSLGERLICLEILSTQAEEIDYSLILFQDLPIVYTYNVHNRSFNDLNQCDRVS